MTMRKSEEEQGAMLLRYGKTVLLGGLISFLSVLLILLLAAVCVSKGLFNGEYRYQLTVVSCVFGSFLGGIVTVRSCPGRGLLTGLTIGAVLFLAQLSLGMLLFEGVTLESGGIGLLFGDLCGGAAAGILGGGGRRKTGNRTKRRRNR